MVNAVSMDNVEHAYAVQQLRKSGKNAKIVSLTLIIFANTELLWIRFYSNPRCYRAWLQVWGSLTNCYMQH